MEVLVLRAAMALWGEELPVVGVELALPFGNLLWLVFLCTSSCFEVIGLHLYFAYFVGSHWRIDSVRCPTTTLGSPIGTIWRQDPIRAAPTPLP